MRRIGLLLSGLFVASFGCGEHPTLPGVPVPIVFPSQALLGSTLAIVVDSNAIEVSDDDLNNVTAESLEIEIDDDTGTVSITPRAVFYGSSALRSPYSAARPGAWVAIVLFDLPATLQYSSYPPQPAPILRLKNNGVSLTGREPAITILGTGGVPEQFYPANFFLPGASFEAALEPDPGLRIRTFNDQGAFDWTEPGGGLTPIGSVQLDLIYPDTCVSAPTATGGSEAVHSTVMVRDDGAGRAKILLVDPNGFTLPPPLPADSHAGLGPVLEVAFTKTCGFTTGDFHIENLLVTDTMGAVLIDERGSMGNNDQHFEFFTLNDS